MPTRADETNFKRFFAGAFSGMCGNVFMLLLWLIPPRHAVRFANLST